MGWEELVAELCVEVCVCVKEACVCVKELYVTKLCVKGCVCVTETQRGERVVC
jgi:hypothetical protein